jgi:hypothetical protein
MPMTPEEIAAWEAEQAVSADTAKNKAMLQAMLDNPPHDALTW